MKTYLFASLIFLSACSPFRAQEGIQVSASTREERVAVVPLEGTATDDGKPKALTTTWSLVSGPGSIEIADPSSLKTTATFRVPGQYTLQLSADDGQNVRYSQVTITVQE
jgi:hypothetical protein